MEHAEVALSIAKRKAEEIDFEAARILTNAEVSRQAITDRAEVERIQILEEANAKADALTRQMEQEKGRHNTAMAVWAKEEEEARQRLIDYKQTLEDLKQRMEA